MNKTCVCACKRLVSMKSFLNFIIPLNCSVSMNFNVNCHMFLKQKSMKTKLRNKTAYPGLATRFISPQNTADIRATVIVTKHISTCNKRTYKNNFICELARKI